VNESNSSSEEEVENVATTSDINFVGEGVVVVEVDADLAT